MKKYFINEIFYSLQGEGIRGGTPSLFLRFGKCNLKCNMKENGFDCDTEFESGVQWTADEIIQQLKEASTECNWIVITGGEPTLQLDEELVSKLKGASYSLAIETNGLKPVPEGVDWITVSPKTAEHTLKQLKAHEVKYVRSHGMGLPQPKVNADHYLISPAFEGNHLPPRNIEWCLDLVKKNPKWRLSLQSHKFLDIR